MIHFFKAALVSYKTLAILLASTLSLFAIGEATSDHSLIVISLIGSGTTVLVAIISAGVSILNARKLSTISTNVDGKLKELVDLSRKVSHAEGVAQERVEERGRQDNETTKDVHVTNVDPIPVRTTPPL